MTSRSTSNEIDTVKQFIAQRLADGKGWVVWADLISISPQAKLTMAE